VLFSESEDLAPKFKILDTIQGAVSYQHSAALRNESQDAQARGSKLASKPHDIAKFSVVARHGNKMKLGRQARGQCVSHRGLCPFETSGLARGSIMAERGRSEETEDEPGYSENMKSFGIPAKLLHGA
jgi:hypothetical protein